MNARWRLTFVNCHLTVYSSESSLTNTSITLNAITAHSSIDARITLTVVNVGLAILACKSTWAIALVIIIQVFASSTISALSSAIINTCKLLAYTHQSLETLQVVLWIEILVQAFMYMYTHKHVICMSCHVAWKNLWPVSKAILTFITVASFPSSFAFTGKVIYEVNAFERIETRTWRTLINICRTRTTD